MSSSEQMCTCSRLSYSSPLGQRSSWGRTFQRKEGYQAVLPAAPPSPQRPLHSPRMAGVLLPDRPGPPSSAGHWNADVPFSLGSLSRAAALPPSI